MKKFLFSLILLSFAIDVSALTTYKGGTNILPEPLPESAGQLIYEEMGCPICHGHQGGGDGFLAEGLSPKPRDFVDLEVMSRLSDMTMFQSIRHGIPDTAMPAWSLSDEQIWDVISYLKTFLADNHMTIVVCINEQRKIDVHNLNLEGKYQISIDREQFLTAASSKNLILIQPKGINVLRYLKKTRRKLVRTHVMVADEGQNGDIALIVVRIRDCFK
jgi:hypothetical protein